MCAHYLIDVIADTAILRFTAAASVVCRHQFLIFLSRKLTHTHTHSCELQQQPLLCVDINLGSGQVGRVAIHDGDNGDDLATNFCQQYDLDESTRDILAVTLQEQIDALLQI